ncbi:MAG: SBBP repeat-containing protein, partial [Pseudomonadota bacterium]
INGIATDAAGNAYVTGTTTAAGFPVTLGAFQPNLQGGRDAFVAKLNPAGSGLVFSTFLGGATDDNGMAIAVDAGGKVYVAGDTKSTNFPRLNGYFKPLPQYNFVTDAFVTVFNPDGGSLAMSAYLGGRACLSATVSSCSPSQPNDGATGIAVDPSGTHIFVTGFLSSVDVNWLTDAIQPAQSGGKDAFVAKIEVDPFSNYIFNIRYATRLGGNVDEQANGIGIDAQGNAYIAGTTYATNFPTTQGALRVAAGGADDVFVAKISTLGVPILLEGGCNGGLRSLLRASLPLNAAGTVAFLDNGVTVGTAPIQNGQAIYTAAAAIGTHKYTAVRSSDGAVSKPVYCQLDQ